MKENNLGIKKQLVSSNDSQIRAIYNAINADRPECVITWSYLRVEVALTATQGAIRFPILYNDSPAANINEVRLNITDEFQVVKWGVFLYKVASSSSIEKQILQTYPNPSLFSKSGEAAALQALYNGYLSATINRRQIIPATDCMQFYRVPDAQQGITTAAYSGSAFTIANSAYLSSEWGLVDPIPSFRLSGSIVNEVYLYPPAPEDMSGTSSTNYVVLFMRGFLIQNGAKFTAKQD